jgi:arsenite methyltransferase
MEPGIKADEVRDKVREGYARIAGSGGSGCGPSAGCCGSSPITSDALAKHIGYTTEELAALPEGANLGLSCGNPNALAELKAGEVVLDLGAGGGFDVFIAGSKLGPTGRAIGVDMTPEMLAKARKNLQAYRERTGWDNVEFRLGEIENLPVADASVDAVLSNCVINLSPDKPRVWREIARVLKPGGRVAVSDLALLQPLPPAIAKSVEALVGCVAGAVLVSETERMARQAGLGDLKLKAKSDYIDGMVGWQDPLYHRIIEQLPAGSKPSDYVTSLEITATKIAPEGAEATQAQALGRSFSTLQVYDPAMCCSNGVCGPQVDPALVRFAADVKWLQDQGVEVRRFNLSQNPAAFVENELVRAALTEQGEAALPLLLVDGQVLASGEYPGRSRLADALGLNGEATRLFTPAVKELVAIGAAIAANCEPCLRYHLRAAVGLGVSSADMASAIDMAAKVKDVPHQAVLKLGARLILEKAETAPEAKARPSEDSHVTAPPL